jgi:hypothetical protein
MCWEEAKHHAFESAKEALQTSPVLGHPIQGLPYCLYTDASDEALGCSLQQSQPIEVSDLKGTRVHDCYKWWPHVPPLCTFPCLVMWTDISDYVHASDSVMWLDNRVAYSSGRVIDDARIVLLFGSACCTIRVSDHRPAHQKRAKASSDQCAGPHVLLSRSEGLKPSVYPLLLSPHRA